MHKYVLSLKTYGNYFVLCISPNKISKEKRLTKILSSIIQRLYSIVKLIKKAPIY